VSLSEHARANRAAWNRDSDSYQSRHAGHLAGEALGVWQIPESELGVLGDVAGKDVLELGCGAAQWSIRLARRGARVVGLDNSERQLEHARKAMAEAGVDFLLVHASADAVPFAAESFDLVFCDYGAMTFADPRETVPEVARLLRRGGLFAFSHETPLSWICWTAEGDGPETALQRDYFGTERWDDPDGYVEFQLPYGDWIALFRANGLAVEELLELRPPEGATSSYREPDTLAWALRWPHEEIWKVRKE
jgi:SAM-dependent methyltransferase